MSQYIVAGLLAWSALMWLAILLIRVNRLRDDVDLLQAQLRILQREREQPTTSSVCVPSCWVDTDSNKYGTMTVGSTSAMPGTITYADGHMFGGGV